MVYESDFYTTRRPYSRPYVSSYTVTSPIQVLPLSSVIQLRSGPYHHHYLPYVAHKRLVTIVHSPVHNVYYTTTNPVPIRIHSRVRPSVLMAELNRIRNLPRPSTESYTEKYLNSKDHIYFDDEAKEIRARVDSLLRRVHVFVPRATPSDFAEEIIPERMRSGDYVRRLLAGRNNTKKDLDAISWYEVPERSDIGNLACVKFIAGKPQSKRKPYYKVADLRPSDIRTDVNLLSFYSKNRQAAANASPDAPKTERELRKARALQTEWSEAIQKREQLKKENREVEAEAEPAPEPEPKPMKKAEPVVEREPEPIQESVPEPEPVPEPEVEVEVVVEKPEPVSEKKKVKKEKKLKEKEKEKEEEVKKYDFEVTQKAEHDLAKEIIQAREEEDRRKAAEAERTRLELEEQKAMEAWQLEQEQRARAEVIAEQERLESERRAEEERLEIERIEIEKAQEEDRKQAEVAAIIAEEEERVAVEKSLEEKSKQQELEERLAVDANETRDQNIDEMREMQPTPDEPYYADVTERDREEIQEDIVNEDDTKVEVEDVPVEHEHVEEDQSPFVLEPEGAENKAEIEEVTTVGSEESAKVTEEPAPASTGGEEAIDYQDEVSTNAMEDAPQVEEDFWSQSTEEVVFLRRKQSNVVESDETQVKEEDESAGGVEAYNQAESALTEDIAGATTVHEIQIAEEECGREVAEEQEEEEQNDSQFESQDKMNLKEENEVNADDVTSGADDVFEWGNEDA